MLSEADRKTLLEAKRTLTNPGFFVKALNTLGIPVGKGIDMLPAPVSKAIIRVSRSALAKSLDVAIATLDDKRPGTRPSRGLHRSAVVAAGGLGGAFGLPALAIELPISTTIMFRAIADTARAMGEDLHDPETVLSCMEVFALGGPSSSDDAADQAYFVIRSLLADELSRAAAHLSRYSGANRAAAPALIKFIEAVAARFGVTVSEKVAAASVPAIGAVGGAAINAIFLEHYQNMAWAHFTVRRLERQYGPEEVRKAWEKA
jgi:hypothetical protein